MFSANAARCKKDGTEFIKPKLATATPPDFKKNLRLTLIVWYLDRNQFSVISFQLSAGNDLAHV
jgi:hypothetical protein